MQIVKRILTKSEVWSEDFFLKIGRGLIFVDALDIFGSFSKLYFQFLIFWVRSEFQNRLLPLYVIDDLLDDRRDFYL